MFCGRIADTGRNPEDICRESKKIFSTSDKFRILWASTREIYNIAQAIDYNCDNEGETCKDKCKTAKGKHVKR